MEQPPQGFNNHLLRALKPSDLSVLTRLLEPVRLAPRMRVEEPNKVIQRVCFPESGMLSVASKASGDRCIEVGLVGYEGMSGMMVVFGDDRASTETYVQIPGSGHWILSEDLRAVMHIRPSVRQVLLQYAETLIIQTTHTALANGRGRIDERLARWLLMAQDRTGCAELPLTHEVLSLILGVRRPGITDAIHWLEGLGMIQNRRGTIILKNRGGLKELTNGLYGAPEAEYQRILGDLINRMPLAPSYADPPLSQVHS